MVLRKTSSRPMVRVPIDRGLSVRRYIRREKSFRFTGRGRLKFHSDKGLNLLPQWVTGSIFGPSVRDGKGKRVGGVGVVVQDQDHHHEGLMESSRGK